MEKKDHPFDFVTEVVAQEDNQGYAYDCGHAVHSEKALERHFHSASRQIDGRAEAGEESGEEDGLVAVLLEELMPLSQAFRGEEGAESGSIDDVAPYLSSQKIYGNISHHDPDKRDDYHEIEVRVASIDQKAGGEKGALFGQRKAQARDKKDHEDGEISEKGSMTRDESEDFLHWAFLWKVSADPSGGTGVKPNARNHSALSINQNRPIEKI